MEDVDIDVLSTAANWLRDGRAVLLATVVRTWGSSPRPEGSMLAIRDDGGVVGSVSGGCIEDDLIATTLRTGIPSGAPFVATYGLTADEAHRFGLPCGGTLELVLEPTREEAPLRSLVERLRNGEIVTRRLDMETGATILSTGTAGATMAYDGRSLVTVHGPRYRMLIIGAGQLSNYVAKGAIGLGYEVSICDPRVEHSQFLDVPGVKLIQAMPDDAVIAMNLDARSAVIALTHDPKLDDLALIEALQTNAFYVGAIGSRRNNAARRERLKLFDLDQAAVDRLRGPIGLFIGSRTPPEIAVSILAEVTACKNGANEGRVVDVASGKRMSAPSVLPMGHASILALSV